MMNILLKTTIKNIFGKPFRTLLVVFSIFACSFVAFFSFDLMNTTEDLLYNMLKSMSGDAELAVVMNKLDTSRLPEGLPEYDSLTMTIFSETIYEDIEGEYQIVSTENATVVSMNPEMCVDKGYIPDMEIGDGETVLTERYAKKMGLGVGDVIEFHDMAGDTHEFKIVKIVTEDVKSLFIRGSSALINEAGGDILSCGKGASGRVLLNILDDTQVDNAQNILEDVFGEQNVVFMGLTDDKKAILDELIGYLVILFVVTFLLVIFVSFSICERIVGERMSFIGTLRSLGLSTGRTAVILLSENALYALIGSIPGYLVYNAIRTPLYSSLFTITGPNGESVAMDFPPISPMLIAAIVAGAVLVECMIPLKAVLKALKTPIRDIIFDNRDTEYRFSRGGIITGIVMACIALISFIFGRGLMASAICMVTAVVALGLLYPVILKGVSSLIIMLAEKLEWSKLALAARESIARKSTVGSGVLCATSATMCIIIYVITTAMVGVTVDKVYESDVVVSANASAKHFSFVDHLEGVTDVEYVYGRMDFVTINDNEITSAAQIYGYPDGGYKMFNGVIETPEAVADGTIYVEEAWAKRNQTDIGDTVKVVFDEQGVFPIMKQFSVAGFFKADSLDALNNNFLISEADFKSIYHDNPQYLLVKCENPDKVAEDIEKYGVKICNYSKTLQQLIDEMEQAIAEEQMIYNVLVGIAIFMTCVGVISNQLIGFEGRRKECAVMLSTAMSKRTLSGVLLLEMFIAAITSVSAGTLMGAFLLSVLKNAADNSEALRIYGDMNYASVVMMCVGMLAVFALTTLFPIKNMRKMKLSEQLKYE